MDIKLFSLCNQDSQEAENGKKHILSCVKDFFPECKGFSEFTSQKRMLVAISQSLLAADIVLVAVQTTMYNTTKRLLCSALDMPVTVNPEIASALKNRLDSKKIKQTVYNANISCPESALIMPTEDYINCGFSLTSGGQHIIYMPVEDEPALHIVLSSLYDYFSDLSEACTASTALKNRHRALIAKTVNVLSKNSVRAAIVGNDSASYLTDFLGKKDASAFCVDVNYDMPSDDEDIKKFAVSAARKVRDGNRTDFGVYISEPLTLPQSGVLCAYIAIANEEGTKTYRVEAENGENPKDLLKVCSDKLLMLLCSYERIGNSEEESAAEKQEDNRLKGILGIIASAAVLASSIAGFITALIMR